LASQQVIRHCRTWPGGARTRLHRRYGTTIRTQRGSYLIPKLPGSAMWIPTASRKCSTIPEFTSLQERIRSTCVETFTTENDDGREANGPAVGVDVRWTVRDQPHLKCNRHLEWDEPAGSACQKVAHWLAALTPSALNVSAIRRRWRLACLLEKRCPHGAPWRGAYKIWRSTPWGIGR
jgi:hypothetical protein